MKETEGKEAEGIELEESPSGVEAVPCGTEASTEKGGGTEGGSLVAEEELATGGSVEPFGPVQGELKTDCRSRRKYSIWLADQSIDGL